ncbi:hypothetical protein CUZ56_00208 [Saezia sanguinis]|uniref:Calcineurin-like phosphoesterase domain-containing protein n=1 Tax=Saezia sanguinis TaxID=1965230 RepID=A0A433SG48_9BURK|nr:hypothetical protein [Saezia sanguinis]RUS67731.1 hypothetical protein CUZ56_00208 [Saezia sanguinis]
MITKARVLKYAADKYGTQPEYLWKRTPDTAILRHAHNRKWYGVLITISKSALGLKGEGQVEIINVEDSALVIAGITDQAALSYGMKGPDLDSALAGAPEDMPTILLSHRPAGATEYAMAGVNVQLSGHTHGGMIQGVDQLLRYANGGYISGSYMIDGMHLYVSNGTGLWNGFPIRLGIPAEITEFVLQASHL